GTRVVERCPYALERIAWHDRGIDPLAVRADRWKMNDDHGRTTDSCRNEGEVRQRRQLLRVHTSVRSAHDRLGAAIANQRDVAGYVRDIGERGKPRIHELGEHRA